MSHDARVIANEVLLRSWDKAIEPTQIDIQKIVYFLHGHHLRDHDAQLVSTSFQALHYGPVQPILLDAFRRYGEEPIRQLAQRFDPVRRVHSDLPRLQDNAALVTFDRYLERYLALGSFEMVEMTHREGTPWSVTVAAARDVVNVGMRIADGLIRERFEGLADGVLGWQDDRAKLRAY